MKKYIKPPFLSTSFSEDGKRAKKRFVNILNTRVKRAGTVTAVIAMTLTLALGSMVACGSDGADKSALRQSKTVISAAAERLWSLRGRPVGEVTDALGISDRLGPFEVLLDYGERREADPNMPEVTLNFEEPLLEKGKNDCERIMLNYADLILALCPGLNSVAWRSGAAGHTDEWHIHRSEYFDYSDDPEAFAQLYENLTAEIEKPTTREYLEAADPDTFAATALAPGYSGAENTELLDDFLEDVRGGRPASLDILTYTDEGDPILSRVNYDGYRFYGGRDFHRVKLSVGGKSYYPINEMPHLKVVRQGGAAYFGLVHNPLQSVFLDEKSMSLSSYVPPELLFGIGEGEKYEEAVY